MANEEKTDPTTPTTDLGWYFLLKESMERNADALRFACEVKNPAEALEYIERGKGGAQ